MWTDSHCHLPFEGVGDDALKEARAAGVGRMITIGTSAEESRKAVQVATAHDDVWATVGLHPHEASHGLDSVIAVLDSAMTGSAGAGAGGSAGTGSGGAGGAACHKVVGVGECGLDYYYEHSPKDAQREVFAAQIELAAARDLALVIHTRDAWDDTFDVLSSVGVPPRTIIHCFTGGPDEARKCLDLGAWLSFSGIVTFKNAADVREAAALCPVDRLLVETDSPYLAPVPHRGKPNSPAFVPFVGAAVAAAKGMEVDHVEAVTTANAAKVFGLTDF